MKKDELIDLWIKNIYVASQGELDKQTYAPSDLSIETTARSWLAYKELYFNGNIKINPYIDTFRAFRFYKNKFEEKKSWVKQILSGSTDPYKDLSEWMAKNPHNMIIIYRTGLDFMRPNNNHCVILESMFSYLGEMRDLEVPHSYFSLEKEELNQLFYKLFNTKEEEEAIALMKRTIDERVKLV